MQPRRTRPEERQTGARRSGDGPGARRRTARRGLSLPLLAAAVGLACASSLDVEFDPDEDFSRYRTWGWVPDAERSIFAPGGAPAALDRTLERHLERELRSRGLAPSDAPPDLFVAYHLSLLRRASEVPVPRSTQFVASHHSSPSYWVEGTDRETRIYDDVRLRVELSDASGQVVWRAVRHWQVDEGYALDLPEAVAAMLARLPRTPARDAAPGPRDPS